MLASESLKICNLIEDSSYPAQKRCQMLQLVVVCWIIWYRLNGLRLVFHNVFAVDFFLKFWVKMNDMTIYLDGCTISHCHISHGIFETRSFPETPCYLPLVGIGNALCITCFVHHKFSKFGRCVMISIIVCIVWGYPPPTNSEIIICSFSWRPPYKPSLSTVCGLGYPQCIV